MDSPRASLLHLTFERRGDRTVLARNYAEPPFRVAPTVDVDGAAYFILVCAGPGIFGGDHLHQIVHVGRGARVILTSQSALQLHPSLSGATATIRQEYTVEEDGELHAEWDPAIPFADARLAQRIELHVASGARLHWSDAVMAGRAGRGESWQFASLGHELRLHVAGSLGYLERYRLESGRRPGRTWMAGRASHAGTTLVVHPEATASAAARFSSAMDGARSADTLVGIDAVRDGLLVGRVISASGGRFAAARDALRALVLGSIFGRAAAANRK